MNDDSNVLIPFAAEGINWDLLPTDPLTELYARPLTVAEKDKYALLAGPWVGAFCWNGSLFTLAVNMDILHSLVQNYGYRIAMCH